ncbi:MAG: histidine phosphatase family protein [Microgenomates group bacterium]
MSTIYLFRHGKTDYNQQHRFTGWLQSSLTDEGIQQAEYLAELLKDKKIDMAIVPNLTRCQKTLDIVLRYHPECLNTLVDDRLLERNYGDLGGKLHQDIISQYGQEQFDKWHRGWADRPPEGESYADVEIRIGEFILELRSKFASLDTTIAICGSSNSIRLFRKIIENASIEEAVSWIIPYDQYFEYTI